MLICKRRNNSTEIQPSERIISNHPTFCEVIMNIWSKQNFNNLYVLQLFWQKDKYLAGKKRLKLKFLVAFFYFFLTHGNILRELSFSKLRRVKGYMLQCNVSELNDFL